MLFNISCFFTFVRMWNVECLLLEFFHLFPGFLIYLMQAFICSTDLPSEQTEKPLLAFSDCGGQLHHIITYYFPLQGTPTLYERNNTYCGTDRCLRQSAGNRRGGTLMEERWGQSWWGIGTLMLPAALSCHSLACPAVLAQAEVQRLNHRGRSGRPGHLIYLFDHRSALGERHCVPSFFIKIGLNGLFLCLGAHREKQRRGRYKRPLEATDVDPLLLLPAQQVQRGKSNKRELFLAGITLIWF